MMVIGQDDGDDRGLAALWTETNLWRDPIVTKIALNLLLYWGPHLLPATTPCSADTDDHHHDDDQ